MAKIKTILKELDNALKSNDFTKFLALIRKDPKCLKDRFDKDRITLFHKLCGLDINKLKYDSSYDSDEEDEYQVDIDTYNVRLHSTLKTIR